MSRSKKAYDVMTFMIAGNIMGGLAIPIFPYTLDLFTAAEFASLITVSVLTGLIAGLVSAVALSRIVPNAEKGAVYTLFAGTFMTLWTSTTGVINSIQSHIDYTSFPLSSIFFGIGIFLLIVTMFSFAGADMER